MRYISLGYFCSVAIELEKLGLRTESSPFDWVVSDFDGVIKAIKNNFIDFLEYDYLEQSGVNRSIYRNTKYNLYFFHDFDKYKNLDRQLQSIQRKYNRRIERFYNSITEPTLFIRYISDEKIVEGVSEELKYIEENYDEIISLLKSFNESNEILFIANEGVVSQKLQIYNVEKDQNDVVSRNPISNNSALYDKFSRIDVPDKQRHIDRYREKERKKKRIYNRIKRKTIQIIKNAFWKEYSHTKQYF